MTSYRIATLAAASSANALLSLLAYMPELDRERTDDTRVGGREWCAPRRRRRWSRPSADLGERLPS